MISDLDLSSKKFLVLLLEDDSLLDSLISSATRIASSYALLLSYSTSTAYAGTTLVLAPGVAATIASVLGLPAGSLPDGLAFGTADVTLYSKLK